MKYIFECLLHDHERFEVEQPMKDEHKAKCPLCGAEGVRIYTPVPHVWEPYSHPHHPERKGVEG